jgi:hypothetical protein
VPVEEDKQHTCDVGHDPAEETKMLFRKCMQWILSSLTQLLHRQSRKGNFKLLATRVIWTQFFGAHNETALQG